MDYLDEEILKIRREENSKEYKDIKKGVYIKDVFTEFERVEIFEKKVSILLPQSFVTMPEAMAKVKYPSEQRPQVIKTSLDTSVNICFSLLNSPLKEENLEDTLKYLKRAMKNMNPAMSFYDEKTIETENMKLRYFAFKSFGMDYPMFNIMFIAPYKGVMLHGVFNCLYTEREQWEDFAIQMLSSFESVNKTKEI